MDEAIKLPPVVVVRVKDDDDDDDVEVDYSGPSARTLPKLFGHHHRLQINVVVSLPLHREIGEGEVVHQRDIGRAPIASSPLISQKIL